MKSISEKVRSVVSRVTPGRIVRIVFYIYAIAVLLFILRSSAVAAQDANANPEHGRELFERRCGGCHSLDSDKEGPRLRGVYGRKAGGVNSFKYSDALKKADVIWDESSLDKWLSGPDQFIADSDMDFHLEKADERSAVIAYLKQLSGK